MKSKITLLITLIISFFGLCAQQLPNAGFEAWGNALRPDGWSTYESTFGMVLGLARQDTADKFSGVSSIELRSDSMVGFPAYGIFPGAVAIGSSAAIGGPPTFYGTPFTYRPDTLTITYKYVTPGTDTARVTVRFRTSNTDLIPLTTFTLDTSSIWKTVSFVLTALYLNNNAPDTLKLQFIASSGQPVEGSTLHVDDVHFGYAPVTATITTLQPQTFCEGGSVLFSGNLGAGLTYQWLRNDSVIPNATNRNYTATIPGDYSVIVSNGAPDTSIAITVTVLPKPVVTLTADEDTICLGTVASIALHASPAGGTLSGTGLTGSLFNPATAGSFDITYIYADNNSCADTAVQTIAVGASPSAAFNVPPTVCMFDPFTIVNVSAGSGQWFWDFGEGTTSTLQSPTHTFTQQGTYPVQLIAVSGLGCSDTLVHNVSAIICASGIENVSGGVFSIYPNPVANTLHISSAINLTGINIQILDVAGQTLLSKKLDGVNNIDVSTLANGTYICRVTDKGGNINYQSKFSVIKQAH